MKIIPTQTERTILLWLILAFMAMLSPQCWWTIRWDPSELNCTIWMLVYVSLLLMTSVVVGTKRQFLIWLVAMSSLLVAHLCSPTQRPPDSDGISNYWHHIGANVVGLVNPHEAIIRLVGICSLVFLASFGISFLLDRFVGPLSGTEQKRSQPRSEPDTEKKKRVTSGRVRLLIAAAVILFVAQAIGNIVRANSEEVNLGQSFLIPLIVSLITVLCCGAMCRLSRLPAFLIGVLATFALTCAGFSNAVQIGTEANVQSFGLFFAYFTIMLIAIFGLLGNSKQPFQLNFGWLSIATAVLACAIPVIGSKYDLHTLLLAKPPLDFDTAAFRKELNSYRDVEVSMTNGFRGAIDFEFVFKPKSANNFFDEFDSSRISGAGCRMQIIRMGSEVDLSGLGKSKPIHITFSKCELSSQQLADLAQLSIPINFVNCNFVTSEIRQPKVDFTADTSFWSTESPTISQFVQATDAFGFLANVSFSNDDLEPQEMDAVLNLVEKTSAGAMISVNKAGNLLDVDDLRSRKNLDRLAISFADLTVDANSKPRYSDYFKLLLETEASVQGSVTHDDSTWSLALGAKGELRPLQPIENSYLRLDAESLKDSSFVYQFSNSGEIEKLWLPECDPTIIRKVSKLKSLKAISFDIGWLGNEHIAGQLASSIPTVFQGEQSLNELTNLEELYFSGNETVNLSLLNALTKLKTIQFPASSTGFSRDLFSGLEEVSVVLDKPIKNGLMTELNAIKSLKRLKVIDIHATNFTAEQFLKQARAMFGERVDVSVVDSIESKRLAPKDFEQHRAEVRQRCIEKYLE